MAIGDEILNIVVDNTPGRDLSNEFNVCETIKYIPLRENYGIAYAQNVGISLASKYGCRYVVFFDQDSITNEILVKTLRDRFEYHRISGDSIGAIGPSLFEVGSGRRYKAYVNAEVEEGETPMLISSGLFTSLEVIEYIGMMESGLFIDLVDSEWCMRCRSYGYRLYMTNLCSLQHKVGEISTSFLGFPIIASATIRYYYKYRNVMLLLGRGYIPGIWKIKTLSRCIVTFMLVPFLGLFRGRKKAVLGNMARGILDALKYKGSYNEERQQ
jgi:glycosyltransferase